MTDFGLQGKVALVTGGSRGIGASIGGAFAEHGATVILASRKQADLDATAAAITASGGKAAGMACHVGKSEEVERLFKRIKDDYGKLDVLVNNAATNPYFGPFIYAPESMYDKTFEINCKGYFLVAQQAAQLMTNQESGGSVINIASIEGLSPSPMMGVYSMTKAAVIMMTKVMAKELAGAKVRCNCICPGLTETKFAKVLIDTPEIYKHYVENAPMGRHAQPEELVGAALYFASDASSYTTGAVLTCDGGSSI
ncbi:MAG TPA: glucose 1-dehydrogenase [Candidatus Hydrogenedentes bacterium]|nr:glucose 1-dehydrogenase [Candidatus Hydrogenedentota bacterium]